MEQKIAKPTIEQMAQTLYDCGMSVHVYDLDRATFLLESRFPNMDIPDTFPQIAFEVFFELMRIESTKMV